MSTTETVIERRMTDEEAEIASFLKTRLNAAEDTLCDFAAKVTDDAADAFEWGDRAIQAAARRRVLRVVIDTIQKHGLDEAKTRARKEAFSAARWPHRSTSPIANITLAECAVEWASVAHDLGADR